MGSLSWNEVANPVWISEKSRSKLLAFCAQPGFVATELQLTTQKADGFNNLRFMEEAQAQEMARQGCSWQCSLKTLTMAYRMVNFGWEERLRREEMSQATLDVLDACIGERAKKHVGNSTPKSFKTRQVHFILIYVSYISCENVYT